MESMKSVFSFYFNKLEYNLKSGKGMSVFNADDKLFSSFKKVLQDTGLNVFVVDVSRFREGRDSLSSNNYDCMLIHQNLDISDLQNIADPLVNKLIYPAFYRNKPVFLFSRLDISEYKMNIDSGLIHKNLHRVISSLVIEQMVDLLSRVNYLFSTPESLKISPDKTIYTPIEQIMKDALEAGNINFQSQVRMGRFYVDFLVEYQGQKIIVECDGKEYHNPYRDRNRDEELSRERYKIIHFTGSEIYNDIGSCIDKIKNIRESRVVDKYEIDEDVLKDRSQRKTLEYITGPVRVLAPAGTGKTKTLINKIVMLINKGVDADSILALAFNKKAAEEMKQRLKDKGVEVAGSFTKDAGVAVQTFHSFGYEIIRKVLKWKYNDKNAEKTNRDILKKAVEKYHELPRRRNIDPLDAYFVYSCETCHPFLLKVDHCLQFNSS